jgi:two-component sensor histidine kinase
VRITVSDSGIGRKHEDRPGSFGSRLVQRLVSSMHGELRVTPNNPGTCVTLVVPVTGRLGV